MSALKKLKLIGIIFDIAGEILRPEKVLNFLKRSRMIVMLKGGKKKTRPHETLTNANFKLLYINE